MQKRYRYIVFILSVVLLASTLCSCKESQGIPHDSFPAGTGALIPKESEGLAFELSSNGKVYILTGIGTCKDKNIKVPSTYDLKPVTTIGESAFKGAEITSISLPSSIVKIEASAFEGCTVLKSAIFSEGLKAIGEKAFSYCPALESVYFPTSLEEISDEAFSYCTGIRTIDIPKGVLRIKDNAFLGCSLYQINVDKENQRYASLGNSLTDKAGEILYKATNLTAIPESVKIIMPYAFYGCSSIESVTVPGGVTEIGEYAFYYCGSLGKITLSEGVTKVGAYAFCKCESLEEICLPSTLTTVGEGLIDSTPSLKKIDVDERNMNFFSNGNCFTVNQNGTYTLVRGFDSPTVPDFVNVIADFAFRGVDVTRLNVPASVTDIRQSAFADCTSLTSLTFEEGPKELQISYRAFMNTGISEVTFPSRVSYIGSETFKDCKSLSKISFADNSKLFAIGSHVFSGSAIEEISLPSSLRNIYEDVFSGCSKLRTARIPPAENKFTTNLFDGCASLEEVYFSGSKEKWQYYADYDIKNYGVVWYEDCPKLEKVICSDGEISVR